MMTREIVGSTAGLERRIVFPHGLPTASLRFNQISNWASIYEPYVLLPLKSSDFLLKDTRNTRQDVADKHIVIAPCSLERIHASNEKSFRFLCSLS